jgi:hypothetical protein
MNTVQQGSSSTNRGLRSKRLRHATLVVFPLLLAAICGTASAQEKNPFAGDPKEANSVNFSFEPTAHSATDSEQRAVAAAQT